jgi:antitoxin (DNA-binding transcriptional repressor) of toxin-antitoxin stability system
MQATLSELHRETRRIVRPVIHGGEEVILTDFGRPVAREEPLSPREWRRRMPQVNPGFANRGSPNRGAPNRG